MVISPSSPRFPIPIRLRSRQAHFPFGYAHGKPNSHSATLTASPLPIPQLKDILKTLLANYALDKLKIEIAGIFTPSVPLPYPLGRTAPEVKRIFALTGSLCED
ncbi:hypothetical protein [Nostoc sp.]